MAEIENGNVGPKVGLLIGPDGHAHVKAETEKKEEQLAHEGMSFIAYGECHTAGAASGGLMYLKNTTADKEFHLTRLYIDGHTITPTDLIVTLIKEPATVVSGTDVSTTNLIQKNYGNSTDLATLGAVMAMSDAAADLTFTGGTLCHSIPVKTMTTLPVRELEGTHIITPGKTVLLGWKTVAGGNATDGEVISISLNIYVEGVGHL